MGAVLEVVHGCAALRWSRCGCLHLPRGVQVEIAPGLFGDLSHLCKQVRCLDFAGFSVSDFFRSSLASSRSMSAFTLRSMDCALPNHLPALRARAGSLSGRIPNSVTSVTGGASANDYCAHCYQAARLPMPPVVVEPGMTVRVGARHNRQSVAVMVFDPVTGAPL